MRWRNTKGGATDVWLDACMVSINPISAFACSNRHRNAGFFVESPPAVFIQGDVLLDDFAGDAALLVREQTSCPQRHIMGHSIATMYHSLLCLWSFHPH